MSPPIVHHLWALYAALALGFLLIGSACLLSVVIAWRDWRWRRFQRRHGGILYEYRRARK